jgi:hypothetical protein
MAAARGPVTEGRGRGRNSAPVEGVMNALVSKVYWPNPFIR